MKGIGPPRQIAMSYNGQSDEYNVLRYGEALDAVFDRINEGMEVIVTSDGEIDYDTTPLPGTYRLVSWDLLKPEVTDDGT